MFLLPTLALAQEPCVPRDLTVLEHEAREHLFAGEFEAALAADHGLVGCSWCGSDGAQSVAVGGVQGQAPGLASSVQGGQRGQATGEFSSVRGGDEAVAAAAHQVAP